MIALRISPNDSLFLLCVATGLLNEMHQTRYIYTFNILIDALYKKRTIEAHKMFDMLLERGPKSNAFLINQVNVAAKLFDNMIKAGLTPNT
ncbi:hypothetical protein Ahy_A02g007069 [Arachis hypogaea]|uniref:Pentatricopeptide repeat-containing protein n=1 Tax=Arachis hypogaea TaxID=3818 RepID=A0A445EBE7_ARAHY|nr:hypothetical protein Ahy_A02g007069 [Arachis hypogaea]